MRCEIKGHMLERMTDKLASEYTFPKRWSIRCIGSQGITRVHYPSRLYRTWEGKRLFKVIRSRWAKRGKLAKVWQLQHRLKK